MKSFSTFNKIRRNTVQCVKKIAFQVGAATGAKADKIERFWNPANNSVRITAKSSIMSLQRDQNNRKLGTNKQYYREQ